MSYDISDPSQEAPGFRQVTQLDTETSLVVKLAQAELNQAVTTARAFPRSVARAMTNITSLATLDAESAAECVYVLPRGGKAIRGPSVRLAEIIASQWGNCQVGSRVVAVDMVDKVVIAEGVFHDLETGMKRIAQVRRRITTKTGKLFDDDMIVVTGNAACSIAMREAVLKGVPKAIWRKAYKTCEEVIGGTVQTLTEIREKAIRAFAQVGVTADQIVAYLEVGGIADITNDHVVTLRAIIAAIKSGEQTVEDYFDAASKRDHPKATPAIDKKPAATMPPANQTDKQEAEPETRGKAEPEPQKAGGGERKSAPRQESAPARDDPETLGGDIPDDAAAYQSLFDVIVNALLDRPVEDVREAFADDIARMAKMAPGLHQRLEAEFAEFAKGQDQGRMDV